MKRDAAAGPRRKTATTPSVREAALRILCKVETENARVDFLLEEWLPGFPSSHRDRALLTQLVNGTLRRRGTLDWILAHFLRGSLEDLPAPIRNTLRLGLFQLREMDRIPAHAAVSESVDLAHRFGHEGTARLVNGVLRRAARELAEVPWPDASTDPALAIAVRHSHPRWMIERWIARYGAEETEALAEANNRVPPVTLRVNRSRGDRTALAASLEQEGLHPEASGLYPDALRLRENVFLPGLTAFRRGLFQVQDEASALVTTFLGARPGEHLLDLCAGPGGKTTHLAELVGKEGRVVAVDSNRRAIGRVLENARRLRLGNVLPVRADGRCFHGFSPDRVLVDAPCSGLGVLARRADARWRRREEEIPVFQALQIELLARAADLVLPGGSVLYATCTLEPEENEGVVERVLAARADLRLEAIDRHAEAPFLPADAVAADGTLRLLPHRHGCDGAFAARLAKLPAAEESA